MVVGYCAIQTDRFQDRKKERKKTYCKRTVFTFGVIVSVFLDIFFLGWFFGGNFISVFPVFSFQGVRHLEILLSLDGFTISLSTLRSFVVTFVDSVR